MKDKYPYLLLILANLFWGGNFVLGSIGTELIPPFTFSLLRWGIAFTILTPFMYKLLSRDKELLFKHKKVLFLLAVTGVAGYNTLIYTSLHWTTSINAAVINPTTPIFIAILSVIILKEKTEAGQVIGIIFSIIGVLFILSKGSINNITSLSFNKGDVLVLFAVFCWAIYSIYIKKYANVLPLYTTFYAITIIGTVLLIPLSFIELYQFSQEVIWNSLSISIILYVGIFAAVVAFLSWNIGVSRVGAAKAGVYLNLLPVFAAILATIFTSETIKWYQLIGGLIVIAGVAISSKLKKSPVVFSKESA